MAVVLGCTATVPGYTKPGVGAQISIESGDNQSATVGTELAMPLVVSVSDANNQPVSGITVAFAVATGGGNVSETSVTTDAMGQARTTLTVGPIAGANSVTANANGLDVVFSATGISETAMQLTFDKDVQPILTAHCVSCHMPAGSAQFTPLTNYTQVRFGTSAFGGAPLVVASDPGASLLVQKTLATATMYTSLGPDIATRDANAKTISDWIAQGALNTVVGSATQIALVSGNNQSATVATALAMPLVVRVLDANDNPVSGVAVVFAVSSGGGNLSATSVTTNATGLAQTTLTIGTTAGSNTVTVSASGLTGTTFTATGTSGTATQIALVSGNNQNATVGTALAMPLVVGVKDANNNPVSGVSVAFAVASGGGTLSVTTATTDAMGQAQSTLTVGATVGSNSVTVTRAGLTGSPVTFTATGTAGAATQIALVSGNNQSATVGAALAMPLVVGVKDANNNPVSGVAITFAVASGGGSLSATTATTNAMGQAQSTFTVGATAGANSVTATRTGLTGSPVTFSATGTSGTATQFALVSGNNQSAAVGTALSPFVVAVKDANGNPIAGFTVVFAVAMGNGSISAATAMTNALGQAQTTLTVGTIAGTNTVTAGASGLTGSPVTFTATGTAGTATQIALVSGNNQTAAVGTALTMPLVVGVKDANNNAVSGVAITFAVASGGGTLSVTTAMTNALGQAQSTLTVGATAGSNSVTATRTGLTGSPVAFTATATSGTATQFALVSGNNQSATVRTALSPFVVAVKDASGNPVAGFNVSFAVAAGNGTLSAASAVTNTLGQAQTTLTLGSTAGTNTVTAGATGLTGSPVTFTATGTAGAATQIALVSGNNQTAPVGTALAMPLVVGVKDANNNAVSGVAITFAVASGGGILSATSVTTNAMGQAQSTLTVGATAGSNSVTVTRTGLTGSPVTFTASGRRLTFAADIQPILTGSCISCHMAGGAASFTPLTNYTQVRFGVSFFSGAPLVVASTPASSLLVQKTLSTGSMYLHLGADTATRDANAKTISDWIAQGAFNTDVGPASQITLVSGNNQSGVAGTALPAPLVVSVRDANLNPVSGFTISFSVSQGGGSVSPTAVATNASGTASTTLTLGTAGGTNSVNANATGLTGSPVMFTATATVGAYSGAPLTGSTNPFDVAALKALKTANVEPAQLAGDGEFLRRVTADIAGRLPTLAEWIAFAASTDPLKRDTVIDGLLASADFGTHWGIDLMAAWLCVDKNNSDATATDVANLEAYLLDAVTTDKPLSTVVSELAQGLGTGGIAFDAFNMFDGRRYMAADRLMETFTGIPTKCSQCHDSKITGPTDDPKWTELQNRGLYRFFQVDPAEFRYYDTVQQKYIDPPMAFVVDGVATNPTNLPLPTDSLAVRRARFAQLLVASKAFPRGTAHRIFSEVMDPLLNANKILAQQLADVKVPDVLAASTSVFTAQGTSLKGYLRVLTRSKLYQLTTKGTTTEHDELLARRTLRRHAAEVLQRGIVTVTGIVDSTSARDDFWSKFGYAMDRSTITERSLAINTIQPLTLLNNTASVPGKVTQSTSIIAGLVTKVDGGTMTLDAAIGEIFRRALTRDPTATELANLKSELTTVTTTKEKLEDVAAVVMASIEFTAR